MGTLQGVTGTHKWVDENIRSSKGTGVPQVCRGGWGAAGSGGEAPQVSPLYCSL